MKLLNLIQGTPEWLAHRAEHFNASDAPAMLGVSPYKTRGQLIRELATGVGPELGNFTQRRLDDGHRFEALARPLAEKIIGEDLYPCVGSEGKLSASFDGLTLAGDTAFEHKTLNDTLRTAMVEGCTGADLPKHYQVQMEQQLMVSGADRVLFMATMWDAEDNLIEARHCWYTSNLELRDEITLGWNQLAADLAIFALEVNTPPPIGRCPRDLPALRIELTGMVTASNLIEFKASALTTLGSINRDLQTDDDFADAEQTIKWAKGVEEKLDAAKQHALSQTASIDELFRTIDEVSAETRRVRLELDRLVKAEKDRRRTEIVAAGVEQVRQHYIEVNTTLGEHALGLPGGMNQFIAEAIKGKKSLASMKDAVATTVASAKIEASKEAETIRANIAALAEFSEHAHLFADRVQLCRTKAPDDLRNLVRARIFEHEQRELARLEAERERIRAEEAAKLATPVQEPALSLTTPAPATTTTEPVAEAENTSTATIKLGDINTAIGPLSITADGLASLGFYPVGTERAAKLYSAREFPAIKNAMISVLSKAELPKQVAA